MRTWLILLPLAVVTACGSPFTELVDRVASATGEPAPEDSADVTAPQQPPVSTDDGRYVVRENTSSCLPGGKVRIKRRLRTNYPPTQVDIFIDERHMPDWSWSAVGADFVIDVDLTEIAEGPHELRLVEPAGRQQSFAFDFTVDRTAPQVTAALPWGEHAMSDRMGHYKLAISEIVWPPSFTTPGIRARDSSGRAVPLHVRVGIDHAMAVGLDLPWAAFIKPAASLKAGTTLNMEVTSLSDCAGNEVQYAWSYVVGGCEAAPAGWQAADCDLQRKPFEFAAEHLRSLIQPHPDGPLLHVSYARTRDGHHLFGRRLHRGIWSDLFASGPADLESLVVDDVGNLYGVSLLKVSRFDGQAWQQLRSPSIAGEVHPSARMLAWDSTLGLVAVGTVWNKETVVRWDGVRWVRLGDFPSGKIRSFTTDGRGRVYVSSRAEDWSYEATYWFFDGTQWVSLPPLLSNPYAPMAVDAAGRLNVIEWETQHGQGRRSVSRWNGLSWESWSRAKGPNGDELSAGALLRNPSGELIVAAFAASENQPGWRFVAERDGGWAEVAPRLPASSLTTSFTVSGANLFAQRGEHILLSAPLTER